VSRFFYGIAISDELKERLRSEQGNLQSARIAADGWSNPALLHITSLFLGPVEEPYRPMLLQAGLAVATSLAPFSLTTGKLNVFVHNKVLWLGFEEKGGGLAKLAYLNEALKDQLTQKLPIEFDERPYKAHLTLARKVKDATRLKKVAPLEATTIEVTEFCLFESLREEGQLVYPIRARFPLYTERIL
jgi:RNA 2',3'-cyclic 3'-phosphodiesterase